MRYIGYLGRQPIMCTQTCAQGITHLLSCGEGRTFPQISQPPWQLEEWCEGLRLRLLQSDTPALDIEWELETSGC